MPKYIPKRQSEYDKNNYETCSHKLFAIPIRYCLSRSSRSITDGRGTLLDKCEFYCLSFFSNSILTPIVAQTMRSMIGIDMLLFSLSINIAINSNIRETEYKMIIALFFIIKLSVD